MSPTPDNKWVHEGCRIFCYEVERKSTTCDRERCALCGLFDEARDPNAVTKRGLVRCCAKDCTVTFHPVCAEIYNAKVSQATKELVKRETLIHEEGEHVQCSAAKVSRSLTPRYARRSIQAPKEESKRGGEK
jgi:hypothetical protein